MDKTSISSWLSNLPGPTSDAATSLLTDGLSATSFGDTPSFHLGADVKCRPLSPQSGPECAKNLFSTMKDIGHGTIPDVLKPTVIQALMDRGKDIRPWNYCFKPADEVDALPGRIPSFEEIERIYKRSHDCETDHHEKASWDCLVNLRLLQAIFEDDLCEQCDDFNVVLCSSAQPHRAFKPTLSITNMIDICVYATLDQNQAVKAAMKELAKISPTISVNHTNVFGLLFCPLMLSIKTKEHCYDLGREPLQIGAWHASQWAFPEWAIGQKLLRQRLVEGLNAPITDEEQEEFKAAKLAPLSKLGFILGIIIEGNRWCLVLSTYNNRKTILWANWNFGSTKSLMHLYAIVVGIRQLTAWARDTYLPWFKENILN
ncbi:hypothetical protein V8C42DRAFT_352525 [Trichoderma barbatum]